MYNVKIKGANMNLYYDNVNEIVTGVFSVVVYCNETRLEFAWEDVDEISIQRINKLAE